MFPREEGSRPFRVCVYRLRGRSSSEDAWVQFPSLATWPLANHLITLLYNCPIVIIILFFPIAGWGWTQGKQILPTFMTTVCFKVLWRKGKGAGIHFIRLC